MSCQMDLADVLNRCYLGSNLIDSFHEDEVHRCVSPSDSDSDSSSSGYSSSQPQAFHIPVIRFRSPLEWLDEKRLTEYDFHQNGIECDLDEIDIYLAIRRRCSKLAVQEFPRDVDLVSPTGTPNPVRHEARRDNVFVNQDHDVGLHARRRSRHVNPVCVFCKNNGEPLSVYGGHVLKDDEGRCACPVLRRYTCPKCGANGDSAHTIKYCPQNSVAEKIAMSRNS